TYGLVEGGIQLPPFARQPFAIELIQLLRCVFGDERQAPCVASLLVDLRATRVRINRHDRRPAGRLSDCTDRHGNRSVIAVDGDLRLASVGCNHPLHDLLGGPVTAPLAAEADERHQSEGSERTAHGACSSSRAQSAPSAVATSARSGTTNTPPSSEPISSIRRRTASMSRSLPMSTART